MSNIQRIWGHATWFEWILIGAYNCYSLIYPCWDLLFSLTDQDKHRKDHLHPFISFSGKTDTTFLSLSIMVNHYVALVLSKTQYDWTICKRARTTEWTLDYVIIHSRKWFLFYFLNFPLQILTKFVCSINLEKQLKHFSFSQLGS